LSWPVECDQEDAISAPIAVIVRFNGDPDELFERFERARRLWSESQDDDYEHLRIEKLGWD
jgi:hypothetical protein